MVKLNGRANLVCFKEFDSSRISLLKCSEQSKWRLIPLQATVHRTKCKDFSNTSFFIVNGYAAWKIRHPKYLKRHIFTEAHFRCIHSFSVGKMRTHRAKNEITSSSLLIGAMIKKNSDRFFSTPRNIQKISEPRMNGLQKDRSLV